MAAEIDRLEIQIETQASKANKELDALISKLGKASSALSGIKTTGISSVGYSVGVSNGALKSFTSTLAGYAKSAFTASQNTRSLTSRFGSFYANCFPVIRAIKSLGKAMESSMDYIETFNYYNVSLDKIASEFSDQYSKFGYDSAESYANSFTGRLNQLTQKMSGNSVGDNGVLSITGGKNLSLDPEAIMNYQAQISSITNAVGLIGETSVNASKAMSMLAADMSSFKNVDLSTVMTNFQSGLIGQSRALYKYGIDITNATLQTYAYKYGIETAVSEMTQADKMQLRLLAILDQSKVAWGDQANTINSVANQYRILKQQISNVARVVGNLFIPVLQAVLPVVNGVLMAFQRLVVFIGSLFGIDYSKLMDGISSGYSGADNAIGDLLEDTDSVGDSLDNAAGNTDNIGDSIDSANDKAKKLKSTILGFDEINKLSDVSDYDSTGDKQNGSTGITPDKGNSGSGGIDLSGAIADALANYESIWNKALENSQNKAQEYADKISAIFSKMWGMIKSGDYEGLGEYIAGGVDYIFEKINSVFNWDKLGPKITEFVDGYTRTVNSLMDNIKWDKIGKTIGDGLNVITNSLYLYLTGIDWVNIGSSIAAGLNGMIESIDWLKLGQTVGAWIMKIPKIVYGFVTILKWDEVGTGIGNALNGVLMEFDGKMIADGINGIVNGIITALKAFIKTVDWSEVAKTIGDILGNLDWGALAQVGLTIGALKLVTGFAGLLSRAMTKILDDAVGNGLRKIFNTIGTDIIKWLPDTFVVSGIQEFGTKIVSALTTTFGSISLPTAGILAGAAAVVAVLIDLWNTSEEFRNNITNTFNIVQESITTAFANVNDSFSGLWEKVQDLWASLQDLAAVFYSLYEESGLKDVVALIAELASTLLSIIGSAVIETIGAAFGALGDILGGLVDIIKGVAEILTGIFTLDGDKILDGFNTIGTGIVDMFTNLGSTLWGWVSGVWTSVWDNVSGLFESAWTGISDWWSGTAVPWLEGIPQWFAELPGRLGEFLGQVVGGAIKWVGDMMNAIVTGVPQIIENIVNFFAKLPGNIWNFFGNIVDGIGEWGSNMISSIIEFVPKIIDSIVGFFESLPDRFIQFGKNIIKGFIDGIKSIWDTGVNVVKDFADGFIDGFTSILGIHSPSTVFEGFGNNTIAGYKNGIDGNKNSAFGSISDLASGLLNQFRNTKSDYSIKGSEMMYGLIDGIKSKEGSLNSQMTSVIKSLTSPFSSIKNTFSSYGNEIGNGLVKGVQQSENSINQSMARVVRNIENAFSGMSEVGISAGRQIANGLQSVHIPVPHLYASSFSSQLVGNASYSIPNYSVGWYANGGFPEKGQLFMARESGPEMVGTMGGRSTVANNNQIVEGIKSGVYDAVVEAMMLFRGNDSGREKEPVVELTIIADTETLYKAVRKGKEKSERRYTALVKA